MASHQPTREGVIAGILGATSVALWFLVVDSLNGRPLFTPAVLGASLFDLLGSGFGGRGLVVHVLVYTLVHYAAFMLVGVAAVQLLHAGERKPSMMLGFLALFIVFELGFYALTTVLARSPLFGEIAWYQFGAANLLAAGLMGFYLWRVHHPVEDLQWIHAPHGRR
jgi:hypothetical protein